MVTQKRNKLCDYVKEQAMFLCILINQNFNFWHCWKYEYG